MNPFVEKGDAELRERNLVRAYGRCELCGSTHEPDNHHLLPKSVYPQHRFEKMNTAILCRRKCHNMAENFPTAFTEAIQDKANFQERIQWVDEHKGIGKYPAEVDYEEMYETLMSEE
jgi:hypothetical protein